MISAVKMSTVVESTQVLDCINSITLVFPYVTVQLSVPWGHISGKSWGNPAGTRVLAIHGLCFKFTSCIHQQL